MPDNNMSHPESFFKTLGFGEVQTIASKPTILVFDAFGLLGVLAQYSNKDWCLTDWSEGERLAECLAQLEHEAITGWKDVEDAKAFLIAYAEDNWMDSQRIDDLTTMQSRSQLIDRFYQLTK